MYSSAVLGLFIPISPPLSETNDGAENVVIFAPIPESMMGQNLIFEQLNLELELKLYGYY